MPKFEDMTLDELIAWRVERKDEIREVQQELDSSNEVYNAKVAADAAARRATATGNNPVIV